MKRLIFIFLMIVAAFALSAQTVIKQGEFDKRMAGGAGDTLTASASKAYSVLIKSDKQLSGTIQVFSDKISGTPGYTSLLQGSLNYSNWFNIDTVTHTAGAADTSFTFNVSNNKYKYLRVNSTATATAQKSKLYVYWFFLY
jgi:hypothetical protein